MSQLTGDYLYAYQKVEALCRNLSFFMNDDEYFQITILEEVLDLLVEAQEHHQSVEYVLGNDYQQFIEERYKECLAYDFSYGTMAIVFIMVYLFITSLLPHLFVNHLMETEYYIFLLFPIIARSFYFINQTLFIQIIHKCSQQLINIVKNVLLIIGMGFIVFLVFAATKYARAYMFFALFLYASQNAKPTFQKEKFAIDVFFIIEVTLIIFGFGYLSRYIQPLYTAGRFQWFIPVLLCVFYAKIILQRQDWKMIFEKNTKDDIYDYYISHCHFLKVKRKMMKDILLVNQDYFTKLQKRNKLFQKISPIVLIIFLISIGMFVSEFQMSVFYMIIIFYGLLGLACFYKFFSITKTIDEICEKFL